MKNPSKAEGSVSGRNARVRLLVSAACRFSLAAVLCVLVFLLGGCGHLAKANRSIGRAFGNLWAMGSDPGEHAQLGETEAEGRRRHIRNDRINKQAFMRDLDRVMLLDKPSKLTDKRIP